MLFALLALEIGYPSAFSGTVGTLDAAGGKLNLKALPLPALLNATWVLTLAIVLRYCQASISTDRRYPYVHLLEGTISPALGGGVIYRREGDVYLSDYPTLLNVTWIAYVVVFPLVAFVASIGLVYWEWTHLSYQWFHILFDTFAASAIMIVFFLYRVLPYLAKRVRTKGRTEASTP